MSVLPVIRKIFDTPEMSSNIMPAAQRMYLRSFPWLPCLRYQAGFRSSGLWWQYQDESPLHLLFRLAGYRISALRKKPEQLPVSGEAYPPVPWFHMPWPAGGVYDNKTCLAGYDALRTRFCHSSSDRRGCLFKVNHSLIIRIIWSVFLHRTLMMWSKIVRIVKSHRRCIEVPLHERIISWKKKTV